MEPAGSSSSGGGDTRGGRRGSVRVPNENMRRPSVRMPADDSQPFLDPADTPSSSAIALPEELMSPQWRQIKRLLDKVHRQIESHDQPAVERIGEDALNYVDIDTETRVEMLKKQNKVLTGLVDEVSKHSEQEAGILGTVDTWLYEATTKLEQDDDDDGVGNVFSAGAGARANATVGQLLNHHTEMGGQLRSVHKKMSSIVEQLKKDKEAVHCTTQRLEPPTLTNTHP